MIQDTVNRMPGTISGTTELAKNSALNGVFVRSFSHASRMPRQRAKVAVPDA